MFNQPFYPMVGTTVAASAEFVDDTGVAADPTVATIKVKDPLGNVTEPVVEHQGLGIFRAEFPITAGGIWVVQAEGVGAVAVVDEVRFSARVRTIP